MNHSSNMKYVMVLACVNARKSDLIYITSNSNGSRNMYRKSGGLELQSHIHDALA